MTFDSIMLFARASLSHLSGSASVPSLGLLLGLLDLGQPERLR